NSESPPATGCAASSHILPYRLKAVSAAPPGLLAPKPLGELVVGHGALRLFDGPAHLGGGRDRPAREEILRHADHAHGLASVCTRFLSAQRRIRTQRSSGVSFQPPSSFSWTTSWTSCTAILSCRAVHSLSKSSTSSVTGHSFPWCFKGAPRA